MIGLCDVRKSLVRHRDAQGSPGERHARDGTIARSDGPVRGDAWFGGG